MKGCKNLVIMCMDYRFQIPIYSWLKNRGILGDCDVISVAGSSLNLLSNADHLNFILNQIELAHKRHGIEKIFIFHHEDCAALGDTSMDTEDQIKFHHEKMDLAVKLLNSHFSDITIKKYFISHKGEFHPSPGTQNFGSTFCTESQKLEYSCSNKYQVE